MSRPAIASAAEAMRPDARCEIVEQMRQLLETAQALLIALTELARRHTHPRVRDRRRSGAEEVTEGRSGGSVATRPARCRYRDGHRGRLAWLQPVCDETFAAPVHRQLVPLRALLDQATLEGAAEKGFGTSEMVSQSCAEGLPHRRCPRL
jgi:hypothetical protein